jgi:hypothetical protein
MEMMDPFIPSRMASNPRQMSRRCWELTIEYAVGFSTDIEYETDDQNVVDNEVFVVQKLSTLDIVRPLYDKSSIGSQQNHHWLNYTSIASL